jgi:hypothetical protein
MAESGQATATYFIAFGALALIAIIVIIAYLINRDAKKLYPQERLLEIIAYHDKVTSPDKDDHDYIVDLKKELRMV